MRLGSGLRLRSVAALGAAVLLAAVGLWMAVGAGAKREGSARAFAYPAPPPAFKMHIDGGPGKVNATSSRNAKFRFHVTYNPRGHVPPAVRDSLKYKCKLDGKRYRKCSSPKRYRHLSKGRHKFRVKAVYKINDADASDPAKYSWKIH
jgi:hypothetical protein